jgi:hypothetical protein
VIALRSGVGIVGSIGLDDQATENSSAVLFLPAATSPAWGRCEFTGESAPGESIPAGGPICWVGPIS